jgi:protein-tyrosine phosphatase
MIDIHCHPLWGVDDGAKSFEVSVAMCKMAAEDGITHLVATPHCNYKYKFQPPVNRAKLAELQAAVGEKPKLLLGCDFHLSYDNIQQCARRKADFTINNTDYLLVELADHFIPEHFDRVFYEVEVADLIPIITHPERNPVCQRKPELVYHWVLRGCLIQITAQSYLGGFGSKPCRLAEQWLDRNLVQFFATDAHDLKHRPPRLSECYAKLAEAKGAEMADLLMKKNPEAVVNGRPMPPQPPPLEPLKRQRSWLSFLGR